MCVRLESWLDFHTVIAYVLNEKRSCMLAELVSVYFLGGRGFRAAVCMYDVPVSMIAYYTLLSLMSFLP